MGVLGEGESRRALGLGLFVAEPAQAEKYLLPDVRVRCGGRGDPGAVWAAVGVADA